MSNNFYTYSDVLGSKILFRGIIDGKRVAKRIDYKPSFYLETEEKTEYKTIFGKNLKKKNFESIKDAKDFVSKFEDIENAPKIYGMERFGYAFIADYFPGNLNYDASKVAIDIIDIEVDSSDGFPEPELSEKPITAITIHRKGGKTHTFACGDYTRKGDEIYVKCQDEYTLCKSFMKLWREDYPDVISGWYSETFDIPYIYNRFLKILGEEETKKLSPFNMVHERHYVDKTGKRRKQIQLKGIASLDYIELYKWYAPDGKSQENYKLGNISFVELGEGKISYDDYGSLYRLHKENFQLFIEYNIKDVMLIVKLDQKLNLFDLAITLTYYCKCNFEDVFAQTRMWDALTYNYLLKDKIIVPPKVIGDKSESFDGAYVKEPQVGMHRNIASFDLKSLYPHLMMQYNLSPDCIIEPENYNPLMRKILSDGVSVEKLLDQKIDLSGLKNVTLTPNGQFFRTDKQGFFPKMLEEMFAQRELYKNLMLEEEKKLEAEKASEKHQELKRNIAKYTAFQMALKVTLNSCYGASGSVYFRFFDIRIALAVTSSGQLSIKWIERKLNQYLNKVMSSNGKDYVIAMDTDSCYLDLDDLIQKLMPGETDPIKIVNFLDRVCKEKIDKHIDKSYQELADYVHAYAQKMKMKRECICDKGFWTAKKRYVLSVWDKEGVRYSEPKLKITGLDMIKSSTPSVIREKMKETVRLMIYGGEESVQDYIEKFRKEFSNYKPEEVAFPKSVNGIKNYTTSSGTYDKGTPIHVRGSILFNRYIKERGLEKKYELIKEGEKIRFIYLKIPNPLQSENVIAFPQVIPKELDIHKYVDYQTQFDKTYLKPMNDIMKCLGWSAEKSDSLEDFFG